MVHDSGVNSHRSDGKMLELSSITKSSIYSRFFSVAILYVFTFCRHFILFAKEKSIHRLCMFCYLVNFAYARTIHREIMSQTEDVNARKFPVNVIAK